MKVQLYVKHCDKCNMIFRTPNNDITTCPGCANKVSAATVKAKPKRHKRVVALSIKDIMQIQEVYNRVHKTTKSYGEISMLCASINADHCVCCGAVLPEGYGHVCKDCIVKAGVGK